MTLPGEQSSQIAHQPKPGPVARAHGWEATQWGTEGTPGPGPGFGVAPASFSAALLMSFVQICLCVYDCTPAEAAS